MISIIIPTHERYSLLQDAIASIKYQSYSDYEIIVVDDCSNDYRYKELQNRNDIKYFRLSSRSGFPGAVRNFGVSKAIGEWIAFLDDDDIWLPNKLEEQMKYSNDYTFICSEAYFDDLLYNQEKFYDWWIRHNPSQTSELTNAIITSHNLVITSTVLVKKNAFINAGQMPENMAFAEDWYTWMNIAEKEKTCYFVKTPLIKHNYKKIKLI